MRLAPALALVLLLGSGCFESTFRESSSVECTNGVCEVCADGECAPCEEDACEACRDGECPELDAQRAGTAVDADPPADVDIDETHDLAFGLAETTYRFQVARNGTGFLLVQVQDKLTQGSAVMASLCYAYEATTATSHSSGSGGSCGGANVGVSGSISGGSPWVALAWEDLDPGTYSITVSTGDRQPGNEALVRIQVDNP